MRPSLTLGSLNNSSRKTFVMRPELVGTARINAICAKRWVGILPLTKNRLGEVLPLMVTHGPPDGPFSICYTLQTWPSSIIQLLPMPCVLNRWLTHPLHRAPWRVCFTKPLKRCAWFLIQFRKDSRKTSLNEPIISGWIWRHYRCHFIYLLMSNVLSRP